TVSAKTGPGVTLNTRPRTNPVVSSVNMGRPQKPATGVRLESQKRARPSPSCGGLRLLGRLSRSEQSEVNRVGHGLVTCVTGVQVIAGIVGREELFWFAWIARRLVEVDHSIVRFAGPNPLVHGLTLCLANVRVVGRSPERRQRGAIDFQSSRMRPLDELPVAGNDVFRGRRRIQPRVSDV